MSLEVTELFGQRINSAALPKTEASVALEHMKGSLRNQASFLSEAVGGAVMALESIGSDRRAADDLLQAAQGLRSTVKGAITAAKQTLKTNTDYRIAQEQAAIGSGLMSGNLASYKAAPILSVEAIKAQVANRTNMTVVGHAGMDEVVSERNAALEAFDNRESRNVSTYGMMYNLLAARQDEFGEAFFPTVTIAPDSLGFMSSIKLIQTIEDNLRAVNGSLDKFGRRNVMRALVDPSIFRDDTTKVVPVYREGTAQTDTRWAFAPEVPTRVVKVDGKDVVTGALAVGKEFSLLAISQTDAMLQAGQMDATDALDPSIRLGAVYIQFTDPTNSDPDTNKFVLRFETDKLPYGEFNASVQGDIKRMDLNVNLAALQISATTKAVNGAVPAVLASTMGTNVARIGTRVHGSVLLNISADTEIEATKVKLVTLRTPQKQDLATSAGAGAAIKALLESGKVVGYDLLANRTNSNRRQRGQLVDYQILNQLYTVPLRSPVTALRPVNENDANDSATIASLVTTTYVRISNGAVQTLIDAANFLREFTSNDTDGATDYPEILGVARHVVRPVFLEDEIDVEEQVDSLTSSDRAEDIQSLLVNKLRDMAARMYNDSYYKIGADSVYDGQAPKPWVIIGTNPYIARYLQVTGDLRTLGDLFNVKIVTTQNVLLGNRIFMSFGMEESWSSGAPNPLHFGNMAWKPELVLAMPSWRNGANPMELTVTPCFRHIVNLPILAVVTVTGIENIIADKAPVHIKSAGLLLE